jgi:RNA polymerase sigma-70 factor (ECF subfamily)
MRTDSDDATMISLIHRIAARGEPAASVADAERALRQLYELSATKLYGLALRVLGNREHAEDVLQEAFLNVWRIADQYRAPLSPPMAWLGLIVRSRALDFLRQRGTARLDETQALDETVLETVAGDDASPLDTTQASEQAWALHECLRKLEARQREVISLAYLRDLSHAELSAQLRLPLGTVKSWIRRGLDLLRGCMERFA